MTDMLFSLGWVLASVKEMAVTLRFLAQTLGRYSYVHAYVGDFALNGNTERTETEY